MTVKELIEQLQQLDPDLHVFTVGYEGGYDNVGISEVKEIALDVHEEWYYGRHEDVNYSNNIRENYTIVKGIVL
jgi:hypothetical protein